MLPWRSSRQWLPRPRHVHSSRPTVTISRCLFVHGNTFFMRRHLIPVQDLRVQKPFCFRSHCLTRGAYSHTRCPSSVCVRSAECQGLRQGRDDVAVVKVHDKSRSTDEPQDTWEIDSVLYVEYCIMDNGYCMLDASC